LYLRSAASERRQSMSRWQVPSQRLKKKKKKKKNENKRKLKKLKKNKVIKKE
jgi:hypothetical protein